jgi:uncharacterized membrane protein YphA (DoxX/SURF4 family)
VRLIALLSRLALAGVFGLAAWVKLAGPQEFAFAVKGFDLLPDHLAVLATFAIPWTEALCAALLLAGLWSRASALVLTCLLAAFIAGIGSVLARGMSVECGCFGKLSPFCSGPLGWCNIVQNTVLLGLSLVVLAAGPGYLAMDRFLRR